MKGPNAVSRCATWGVFIVSAYPVGDECGVHPSWLSWLFLGPAAPSRCARQPCGLSSPSRFRDRGRWGYCPGRKGLFGWSTRTRVLHLLRELVARRAGESGR
jgi:hypothetical protein